MTLWVLHVDLDQFIAAVELQHRPELRGRRVVVGGDGDPTKRGVVSTASYEARELGVRSGMPLRTAARRCPDCVFLPVRHELYEAASAAVMSTLHEVLPVVEELGWDEAFAAVETDDPEAVARRVQERVRAATGLDCTVGIGRNRLQAKLATGFGKPAGVFRISGATWFDVLGPLPTEALWGIGTKTSKKLAEMGIRTVSELAAADPDRLAARFGPATVGQKWVARSHSREHTFQQDVAEWPQVQDAVRRLASQVAGDVAADGRTVGPRRGEGAVRALRDLHARSGAAGPDPGRGGDRARGAGCPRQVRRRAPRPARRRAGGVRRCPSAPGPGA